MGPPNDNHVWQGARVVSGCGAGESNSRKYLTPSGKGPNSPFTSRLPSGTRFRIQIRKSPDIHCRSKRPHSPSFRAPPRPIKTPAFCQQKFPSREYLPHSLKAAHQLTFSRTQQPVYLTSTPPVNVSFRLTHCLLSSVFNHLSVTFSRFLFLTKCFCVGSVVNLCLATPSLGILITDITSYSNTS
jgi:hypothetical protein